MTGNIAIFWPMIVQAVLTFGVYGVLVARRRAAGRTGRANPSAGEPEASATAARNLANQFELPVLFFVVGLALYVTNGASWYAVLIAWFFALSRIAHAAVHLGANPPPLRGALFGAGMIAAILLWLVFALHIANFPGAFGAQI